MMSKALVLGLMLTLPLVEARVWQPEAEEPGDSNEAYEEEAQDAMNEAEQEVKGEQDVEGPVLPVVPKHPQLLQQAEKLIQQAALPWRATPAPAAASKPKKAMSAKESAKLATHAAVMANKVAAHSVKIIGHSKSALKHALGALHDARVDSTDLKKDQKEYLKKAEAHLREATKKTDYGKLHKLQEDLDNNKAKSEREQMRREIQEVRDQLRDKNINDKDIEKALHGVEAELDDGPVTDESKAELERIRQLVDSLDAVTNSVPAAVKVEDPVKTDEVATPVQETGLDIDTQMPYGDLEPFGREDTAQELTESSIKESDAMVDQLERAEVAEEKRAVFRALTRLRGAAITSFDGVARSQTGSIDEYNKVHKWRTSHPLHHLADEESDVSKWAFPDNAD